MKDVCCSTLWHYLSTGECAAQKAFLNISAKGALSCGNFHVLCIEGPKLGSRQGTAQTEIYINCQFARLVCCCPDHQSKKIISRKIQEPLKKKNQEKRIALNLFMIAQLYIRFTTHSYCTECSCFYISQKHEHLNMQNNRKHKIVDAVLNFCAYNFEQLLLRLKQ